MTGHRQAHNDIAQRKQAWIDARSFIAHDESHFRRDIDDVRRKSCWGCQSFKRPQMKAVSPKGDRGI